MSINFSKPRLRAVRMIAQALAPSAARPITPNSLVEAASWMVATQGQNYVGGLTGLAIRAGQQVRHENKNTTALDEPLTDNQLIRTWSQRGTIHFLHANDFWVVQLCGGRSTSEDIERRAAQWGIGIADYRRLYQQVIEACQIPMSRQQIREIVDGYGVEQGAAVTSNLLRHLGARGTLIQGAKHGNHDSFVQAVQALGPVVLSRFALDDPQDYERAVSELLLRYVSSRGPVSIADFTWWSTLPKTVTTKAARQLVDANELATVTVAGKQLWVASWQLDVTDREVTAALRRTKNLPPFDEYLMSYTDRDAIFHKDTDPLTVLTKNGLSWEFQVRNGFITGRAE